MQVLLYVGFMLRDWLCVGEEVDEKLDICDCVQDGVSVGDPDCVNDSLGVRLVDCEGVAAGDSVFVGVKVAGCVGLPVGDTVWLCVNVGA